MELVSGTDLAATLAQRDLSVREISEVAFDLAEALEYVHAQGVIHRDIKPANVMLVEYGTSDFRARARLTDFGIAIDTTGPHPDESGVTTGTAAYLSPEQASHQQATTASDIYSLGLVLLECFTRTMAFPGGMVDSALARLRSDPPIPPELPDDWTALLTRMTAREPENRPQAAELALAFREAVIAAIGRHRQPAS
jgi:serine/threonine protein kinase